MCHLGNCTLLAGSDCCNLDLWKSSIAITNSFSCFASNSYSISICLDYMIGHLRQQTTAR